MSNTTYLWKKKHLYKETNVLRRGLGRLHFVSLQIHCSWPLAFTVPWFLVFPLSQAHPWHRKPCLRFTDLIDTHLATSITITIKMISNANGPDKPESKKCFPNLTVQRLGNLKLQTFTQQRSTRFSMLFKAVFVWWNDQPCVEKLAPVRRWKPADDIYCPTSGPVVECMWISCGVKSPWYHPSIWSGLGLMGDPGTQSMPRVNETTPYTNFGNGYFLLRLKGGKKSWNCDSLFQKKTQSFRILC